MTTNNTNGTKTTTTAAAKKNEWQKREIGALWKRESKASGKKYLVGHVKFNELGTETLLKVVVFPNATKKNEKSPDFVIYVSQAEGDAKLATGQAKQPERIEAPDDVL